jgi:hypothetical protein
VVMTTSVLWRSHRGTGAEHALSEGAVAASHEIPALGPSDNVNFVLAGNTERPNGGILAVPGRDLHPDPGHHRRQRDICHRCTGDGDANTTASPTPPPIRSTWWPTSTPFWVLTICTGRTHDSVGAYGNVDPHADGNIITTSGNMTDILVPAAPGALPLFIPLAQAPRPILVALDPAVRTIIETGYNRATDPSQQVPFALLPPPSAWATGAQNVAAGSAQTAQELPGAALASLPSARTPVVRPPSSLPSVSPSKPPTGSTTNLSNSSGPQTFSPVQQNVAPRQTIVSGGGAGPLTPTSNTSTPPQPAVERHTHRTHELPIRSRTRNCSHLEPVVGFAV